jgi:hypothetical protein
MCLITQVTSLDTSSMLLKWFLRNKSKSGGLSPPDFDLSPKLKKPLRGNRFRSIEEVSNEVIWVIRRIKKRRRPDRNTRLSQTLDHCDKARWRLHWRPVKVFCKINSFLKRKNSVCRTFEMTHVCNIHHASWTHRSCRELPAAVEYTWSFVSRIVPHFLRFKKCRILSSSE